MECGTKQNLPRRNKSSRNKWETINQVNCCGKSIRPESKWKRGLTDESKA